MTTLLIVRHGRTEANASGRLQGRMDLPLDEVGRRQAREIAQAVGPVDRVISSPLLRARETAAAFGQEVEVDDRWVEIDYGDLDGMLLGEVPADLWKRWRTDPDHAPTGGESMSVLNARVHSALADLSRDPAAGTVVVVSHVSPIKASVLWTLGVQSDVSELTWRMFVSQASITRIGVGGDIPMLLSFNEVSHLDGSA